ncbi:MAG: type II toxin-antitoxin system Phd/YefM family antitoxin [Candidatus Eremiobacteraeota bacterium]|nr:type II toxin-antitoxin system Phd/YefM family antitoxin [Candidatus Eremiobacteraeota bacterium]
MKTFNVHEAKTQFSAILSLVASGEEVVVAKAGKPVAVISPYREPQLVRSPGLFRGQIEVKESFFEPMPADFLEYFE